MQVKLVEKSALVDKLSQLKFYIKKKKRITDNSYTTWLGLANKNIHVHALNWSILIFYRNRNSKGILRKETSISFWNPLGRETKYTVCVVIADDKKQIHMQNRKEKMDFYGNIVLLM